MKHVAKFVLKTEYECSHCQSLPPDFDPNNLLIAYKLLFGDFKKIREEWGKPIPITSGYRCPKYQKELYEQGISDTPCSVHVFGLALDLDCKDEREVHDLVRVIENVNPDLRMGYWRYLARGQSFIHIDCGYLISPRFSLNLIKGARW